MVERTVFPNYLQVQEIVPGKAWIPARFLSVGIGYGIILTLFIHPPSALFVFWRIIVPVLPILFFVAPGLWRNICPMAALNQTPRLLKISRNLTPPGWLKNNAYLIATGMFLVIVPTRKVLFNSNGPALGLLLLFAFSSALVGGLLFKGKSGWCSSICPLLPVQRVYGQTPFVPIPNNYCRPCVGCAKNCYDFNPAIANLADQYDADRRYSSYRKYFAGIFPGLILSFYLVPDPPAISVAAMYLQILLFIVASLGVFVVIDTFLKTSPTKIATIFGAIALNYYYLFNIPTAAKTIQILTGYAIPTWSVWLLHLTVFMLTTVWVIRTYGKEPAFVREIVSRWSQIRSSLMLTGAIAVHQAKVAESPEVTFEPKGVRVLATPGRSLLDIAESNGLAIEVGCRMGVCGADPIAIHKGMENLSLVTSDEKGTLERLGLPENTRLACCAKVRGPVTAALKPDPVHGKRSSAFIRFKYDPHVENVVVIGNGIAGITAADHVRRRHPDCRIHVIGKEKHHLYNRMGLNRLIYGRSAMQGLYLMPDSWYDDHQITCWLNTQVARIDADQRNIVLADGETLPYDRLILAMGSRSTVPTIDNFGLQGSFVLREADDAMSIRHYAQQHACRRGVVAGGGLLGLEAAYALHKLGMQVTVLERSRWPMRRQLDERGGQFLKHYLAVLGIEVLLNAEVDSLSGGDRVEQVALKDGSSLPCDIFLVCAGIKPNTELAQQIGLATRLGILVDDHMRTSLPDIYAAGDVAEFDEKVPGLWPIAVEQAEIAAINALGGDRAYSEIAAPTMLKVAGVDLFSVGRIDAQAANEKVIKLEDETANRYRKLVIADGKIAGAILLGFPEEAPLVTGAIKSGRDVTDILDALQAGNWKVLN